MDQFAILKSSEKIPFFETTAAKLGISPELVEKDFWVCWTLKHLFSLDDFKAHLTFKGGTSLSKCYNAIQRFSEDIDIAIERKYLEHGKIVEPSSEVSNKENQKRIEMLMSEARMVIYKKILPALRQKFADVLVNDHWAIELDPEDSLQQTLLFIFPSAMSKTNDYVKPVVKIELGARADHWPAQSAKIVPYVSTIAQGALAIDPIGVNVLSAERTFWEKAMILHRLYHSPDDKSILKRMSRHYYDIYEMDRIGIFTSALEQNELMQSVVTFNKLFFRYSWLNYDEARRGSFHLVPENTERLRSLKIDYRQMEPMFFKDPPTFDEIIAGLKKMEERINNL